MLLAIGCGQTASVQNHTAEAREYIDGWTQMGMWLPDQHQIDFFRSNLPELQAALESALGNPAHEVRMRAGYVIGKLGANGRSLGPALVQRLRGEPDRLVRLYLYGALREVNYEGLPTVALLKEKFASLDENNQSRRPGASYSDYLDADEMILIAAALYVLDHGPDRRDHLEFILKWLRRPEEKLSDRQRTALWERRWAAVLALEGMHEAADAIPLLEALKSDESAPTWVPVHVPRVLESIQ